MIYFGPIQISLKMLNAFMVTVCEYNASFILILLPSEKGHNEKLPILPKLLLVLTPINKGFLVIGVRTPVIIFP